MTSSWKGLTVMKTILENSPEVNNLISLIQKVYVKATLQTEMYECKDKLHIPQYSRQHPNSLRLRIDAADDVKQFIDYLSSMHVSI
jgi:hypothetical protein